MGCLNEGQIQAYIDGELNESERKDVEVHLFQCEKCKQTYNDMSALNNFVSQRIKDYKSFNQKDYMNKENLNLKVKNQKGVVNFMKKYKKIAAVACAALVVSTCFTVKPIRAAIADAVSIFRATDVKSINVSYQDLQKLQEGIQSHNANINIDKIGNVKCEGGKAKYLTIDKAREEASDIVKFPKSLDEKNIKNVNLTEASKIDFTINVNNVNEIVKSLGGKKLLPENLDGKTFVVDFPKTININYEENNKKIYITETKIPEIKAPSDVNVDEIVEALIEIPVLPASLQDQLKSIKDWKSTLYVPSIEKEVEEFNINGAKAFAHFDDGKYGNYSTILLFKDGVIHSISGNLDKDQMIEIAKSMR